MGDFASLPRSGDERIVYVRPVSRASLPADVQAEIEGEGPLYAIHGSDGVVLALADDRSLAFELARMNDFAPLSVH